MIRLAKLGDAAAISAIYAPYVEGTSVSFETMAPSAEEFEARMRDATGRYPWLVFEDDGALLGYAYSSRHRTRAAYRWSAEVSVYVAEGAHRRGVATQLYRTLFQLLRELGYVNAFAGITLPNPASVALHESVGFARIGVFPGIGFKFGNWHDVGWWHLALRKQPNEPEEPRTFGGADDFETVDWEAG